MSKIFPTFYIPSYKRAGRVTTIGLVANFGHVVLCVRADEVDAYAAAYPGITIESVGAVRDIAETREQIRLQRRFQDEVWWMVDDDITGFYFKGVMADFGKLREATLEEVGDAIADMTETARANARPYLGALPDRVTLARPHKGWMLGPARQFVVLNQAATQLLQYRLPVLEDVDATLQVLQAGGIVALHPWLGQSSPATARKTVKGGCGEYREKNPGYYREMYEQLARLYPGIVELKDRSDDPEDWSHRIYWSKAVV